MIGFVAVLVVDLVAAFAAVFVLVEELDAADPQPATPSPSASNRSIRRGVDLMVPPGNGVRLLLEEDAIDAICFPG